MILAFCVFQHTWYGRAGLSHETSSVPFHDTVTAVAPGWPAAEAGIRRGDVVDLHAVTSPDRWRFRHFLLADRPYSYVLVRGAVERRVTVRPKHPGWSLAEWGWIVGALGSLIFATLIAWQRPWLVEARVLCFFLVFTVVEVRFDPTNWITPWPKLDFTLALLGNVLSAEIVLVAYTTLFGWPLSPLRRIVTVLAFLDLGVFMVLDLAADVGTWSGAFDLLGGPIRSVPAMSLWTPATCALILLTIALAFGASRGRERVLFVWTTALPFVLYLMSFIASIPAFESAVNPSVFAAMLGVGYGVPEFLTPFAIGYALLRRSRFSPMTAAAGTMA